jgi:hypothetical protein
VREFARVDDDAALGPTVRDANDGALPRHPHGQRLDLVEGDVLVEADAALGGAARHGVLHAVTGKDADGAVVHADRDGDLEAAHGRLEDLVDVGVELHALGDVTQLHQCHLERVHRCWRCVIHHGASGAGDGVGI